MSEQIRPYWRPEPKLYDVAFWSLLIPAGIYVVGVVVYGAEALKAGSLTWTRQGIGSMLMVIGGEVGTLSTAMEVFRKHKADDIGFLDWAGLWVSLIATLGTLFVIFSRQTQLAETWVSIALTYGPLALLLCSGLDFYANVMELGFYRASFDARWHKWNDDKWQHEQRERNRIARQTQDEPELAQVDESPMPEMDKSDRHLREIDIWRDNPRATQQQIAEMLQVSRTTVGNDLAELAQAGKVRRNGRGVVVAELANE